MCLWRRAQVKSQIPYVNSLLGTKHQKCEGTFCIISSFFSSLCCCFGTYIEDSLNINHIEFGVSNSNPLVPPTAQSCTYVYANCVWTICYFSSNSLAHAESNAYLNWMGQDFSQFWIIQQTYFFSNLS